MKEEELIKYQLEQHQRNQEIDKTTRYLSIPERAGFIAGVEWADSHPRKGFWDAEKVCKYLEEHAGHYMTLENDEEGELQAVFYKTRLINDLRKAMEEEL